MEKSNRICEMHTTCGNPKSPTYDESSESEAEVHLSASIKWPLVPEELWKVSPVTLLLAATHYTLVLAPTIFIVIGITIMAVRGEAVDNCALGKRLEKILRLGPTLFPLVFVAVAASTLKHYGRFSCQQGTKLEVSRRIPGIVGYDWLETKLRAKTLEMLFASRSVWATVESQLRLRRRSFIGALLLLLWCLSPIGGQASLRALGRSEKATRNDTELRYLYSGPMAEFLRSHDSKPYRIGETYHPLLATSHMMKIAPRDNWGNVRVPRLELLPGAKDSNTSEWLPLSPISQVEQLSSLLGVPVIGIEKRQAQVSVDFTLETSYMTLECASWEEFKESHPSLSKYKRWWQSRDPLRLKVGDPAVFKNTSFFLDGDMPAVKFPNGSTAARDPRSRLLFFASGRRENISAEYTMSATKCVVRETHVEAAVTCPTGWRDCEVTRMRRSLIDKRPESNVPLDSAQVLQNIIRMAPYIEISADAASSTTELFLHNSVGYLSKKEFRYINMSEVSPPLFASRLSLLLNTWYQILQTPNYAFKGDIPTNISAYGFDFGQLPANGSVPQSVVDAPCRYMCTRSTKAVLTHTELVFTYHPVWLALLFASSGVLLLVGLAGIVVRWRTLVPDAFGYVASMTYHNAYLPLPERGGVLDGMRRARILRDLPVSISDVGGDNPEVGRIAFTSLKDVRRLEKGRKYV